MKCLISPTGLACTAHTPFLDALRVRKYRRQGVGIVECELARKITPEDTEISEVPVHRHGLGCFPVSYELSGMASWNSVMLGRDATTLSS